MHIKATAIATLLACTLARGSGGEESRSASDSADLVRVAEFDNTPEDFEPIANRRGRGSRNPTRAKNPALPDRAPPGYLNTIPEGENEASSGVLMSVDLDSTADDAPPVVRPSDTLALEDEGDVVKPALQRRSSIRTELGLDKVVHSRSDFVERFRQEDTFLGEGTYGKVHTGHTRTHAAPSSVGGGVLASIKDRLMALVAPKEAVPDRVAVKTIAYDPAKHDEAFDAVNEYMTGQLIGPHEHIVRMYDVAMLEPGTLEDRWDEAFLTSGTESENETVGSASGGESVSDSEAESVGGSVSSVAVESDAAASDKARRDQKLAEYLAKVKKEEVHRVVIVSELMSQYTLKDVIDGKPAEGVAPLMDYAAPDAERVAVVGRIMRHITEGIAHMHSQGYVHHDLKPANVLLKWDENIGAVPSLGNATYKVGDLGMAENIRAKGDATYSLGGTPLYLGLGRMDIKYDMATGKYIVAPHGYEEDVWALGLIAFELWTGEALYDTDPLRSIFHNYYNPSARVHSQQMIGAYMRMLFQQDPDTIADMVRGMPRELQYFITRALWVNPKERMTADELLKHTFLKDYAPRRGWLR